ncbi:MAG: metallophosphoesterase, partial [Firmicutes bacterium]|nr:metallophosphoesterase [Bacillota bacterium]
LISDIKDLSPDLILFPGDMVIREQDDYQSVLDLVSALSEIAPCYGVLGNHESERIYYRDDKALPLAFESAGLKILRNAKEDVRIGNDTIQLIGVEGTSYGF